MTQVVIIGAGIAGVPAAYAIKNRLGPNDRVTVVSDRAHFNFVPSNPWVALGWRNRSDITFNIDPYLEARDIHFVARGLAQVHPDTNQDAKRYLGEVALADMERERRNLILAELPENQPGVEFHGGGT